MEFDLEQAKRLESIFMPSLVEARTPFFNPDPEKQFRLAHYSSAETAVKIIQSQSLWLRNARGMQDYSEVRYGYNWLRGHFEDEARRHGFIGAFQRGEKNAATMAINLFNQNLTKIDLRTFISCFSTHYPSCEPHGRLSMWRAFGKQQAPAVALIFNIPEPYCAMPLFTFLSCIDYPKSATDHWREFERIIEKVRENQDFIDSVAVELKMGWIFSVLLRLSVSLKHPAFEEEREWRLVHFPELFPSQHLKTLIQSFHNVPQIVWELPLKNKPEENIRGIELSQLLHSVKIGPTQHADAVWPALVAALDKAGVPHPEQKVKYSTIPLRD